MGVHGVELRLGQVWRNGAAVEVGLIEYLAGRVHCWRGSDGHCFTDYGASNSVTDHPTFDLHELVSQPAGDSEQATTFGPLPGIEVHEIPGPAIDPGRTNPKDAIGDKKLALHLLSPIAEAHWVVGQYAGMLKYGAWNWRAAGVRASIYISALRRHLAGYQSGEEFDPVDGSHHLGNIMACAAILLEAREIGKLVDDRPPCFSHRSAYAWAEDRMSQLKVQYADKSPRHYNIGDTAELGGIVPTFVRKSADDTEGGAA